MDCAAVESEGGSWLKPHQAADLFLVAVERLECGEHWWAAFNEVHPQVAVQTVAELLPCAEQQRRHMIDSTTVFLCACVRVSVCACVCALMLTCEETQRQPSGHEAFGKLHPRVLVELQLLL